MTKKHALLMLLCCLIPLAALSAIFLFGIPAGSVLLYGIVLICPLMMLFMMMGEKDHDHATGHVHGSAIEKER